MMFMHSDGCGRSAFYYGEAYSKHAGQRPASALHVLEYETNSCIRNFIDHLK